MGNEAVLWNVDSRGVATLTLNRPEVNNAYDEALIQGLHDAMDELGARAGVRALLVRGAGRHFQAGADLNWIAQLAAQPQAQEPRGGGGTRLVPGKAAGTLVGCAFSRSKLWPPLNRRFPACRTAPITC